MKERGLGLGVGGLVSLKGPGGSFFFFLIYFWLCWVFVAACGLFSHCGEWGPFFVVVHELLIAVACLVVEHGL